MDGSIRRRGDQSPAFDARSGLLTLGDARRRLEPRAAAVLAELSRAGGELVSREQLLDRCWGEGSGSDEALTQAVAQVRRAFDELGAKAPVETLAKRGYRLAVPLPAASGRPGSGSVRPGLRIVLVAIVALAVALTVLRPHALRHVVRHSLGLGAQADHRAAR